MKKIIYICFCIIMILSISSISFANTYTDIDNSKYINAIEKLSEINVLNGYTDNTFSPKKNITRAEACKVIVSAFKLEKVQNSEKIFSDVLSNHWGYSYINIASSNGYINGYLDGTFKPDDNISGAEIVTIITRCLGYNLDNEGNWPDNYINKAKELGVFTNVNNISFSDKIDRETVAQILWDSINIPIEDGKTIYEKNFKKEEYSKLEDYTLEYGIVTSDIMYKDENSQISIYDIINDKNFLIKITNTAGIEKGTILKMTKLLGTNEYTFKIVSNTYQVIKDANDSIIREYSDGKYIELIGTNLSILNDAKIFYINKENEIEETTYTDISNYDIIYPIKGDIYKDGTIYNIIVAREYDVSL